MNRDYSNAEVCRIIDDYIHSERDRAILKRRLIDGIGFEAVAEEFEMSERQVKTIVYKGREKIFSKMRK